MKILKRSLKNIAKFGITILMYIFRIFPIEKNKIIFSAFSARTYGDNPKYIAEYIIKNNLNYKCVFVLEEPEKFDLPSNIIKVKYNSLRYIYELVTAGFWIDNTRKQSFVVKRKKQIYIQTWHGAVLLKKIEKDAEEVLEADYINTAIKDSKNMDYLLVSSEWGKDKFRKCFWFDGKIEITGSPRIDVLLNYNDEIIEKIHSNLNLDKNKKILLYAPTFRRDHSGTAYNMDYKRVLVALNKRFGGEWVILAKLHPSIANLSLLNDENIIDVSKYPDIAELYLISDMLITDYSSTMFDFSIMKKPILLYASDVEAYINDRDFNLNYFELPFKVSENNDDLEKNIIEFDNEKYIEEVEKFYSNLGIIEDGKACERVLEIIKKESIERN